MAGALMSTDPFEGLIGADRAWDPDAIARIKTEDAERAHRTLQQSLTTLHECANPGCGKRRFRRDMDRDASSGDLMCRDTCVRPDPRLMDEED